MSGWVSYGSLQTQASSASGAGTNTAPVPSSQHLGQEGMETAFLDASGTAGTLLEEANESNNFPGPKKGPLVALNVSSKATR